MATIKKAQKGTKEPMYRTGYLVPVPGSETKYTDKQKDSVIKSWGRKSNEADSLIKSWGGTSKPRVKKAKNGKSFPDLNKDGKITKADILKGRGVIAKKGMKVKKAQDGARKFPDVKMTSTKNYDTKITNYPGGASDTTTTFRPAGGAKFKIPSVSKKPKAKAGAKMTKKCKYGCY